MTPTTVSRRDIQLEEELEAAETELPDLDAIRQKIDELKKGIA